MVSSSAAQSGGQSSPAGWSAEIALAATVGGVGIAKITLNAGVLSAISQGAPVAQLDTTLTMVTGYKNLAIASKGLMVFGAAASFTHASVAFGQGDWATGAEQSIDGVMGIADEYGGIPGLALSLGYTTLRGSGAFEAIGSAIADMPAYNTSLNPNCPPH